VNEVDSLILVQAVGTGRSIMKRVYLLIVPMLMVLITAPHSFAGFSDTPTLDLTASSNLAGATDAVYTFHFENTDKSTHVVDFLLLIPAGYSVNPTYVTKKSGITIMTGKAGELGGFLSGTLKVTTTSMSGHYVADVSSFKAELVLTVPTPTAEGALEISIPSVPGVGNAVFLEASTVPGFFINPSEPGTYTWGPSLADPASGPSVATVPRPSFTQTVTIVGPSTTTEPAATTSVSAASPTTIVTTSTFVLPETTGETVVTEPETTTMQAASAGKGPSTGTLAILGVVLIAVFAGAAIYALRRKKPAGQS